MSRPPEKRSAPRSTVVGTARLLDGTPWAFAEVTLSSSHFHATGEHDVVRCTTDVAGRFRAAILEQRPYSCWAQGQGGSEPRFSWIEDDVMCGAAVTLHEQPRPGTPAAVRVIGLDAWQHRAPFSARIRPLAAGCSSVDGALEGDAVQLPPLPQRWRTTPYEMSLHDGAGRCLYTKYDLNTASAREAAEAGDFELPPPRRIVLALAGPDGPASGVEVFTRFEHRFDNPWDRQGATGADGRFLLEVADHRPRSDHHSPMPSVMLRGHGFAESLVPEWDLARAAIHGSDKLAIELERGWTLTGRLAVAGRPPDRSIPLVLWSCVSAGPPGARMRVQPVVHRTDPSGHFTIQGRHAHLGHRLGAVLEPSDLAGVRHLRGRAFWPLALLHVAPIGLPHDTDLGTIDLANLCRLELQAQDQDGKPLDRGQVLVGEAEGTLVGGPETPDELPYCPLFATTTPQGALTLLVHRGLAPGILLATRAGYWMGQIAIPLDADAHTESITLPPPVAIHGRVLDARGQPCAGAYVSVHWVRWTPSRPVSVMLARLAAVNEIPFDHCTSDAAGEFSLNLPLADCDYGIDVFLTDGSHRGIAHHAVHLGHESLHGVELHLEDPRQDGSC